MSRLNVAVIGCGYWGPNLIRNFSACPLTNLVAVCDADPGRLESIASSYHRVQLVQSLDELLTLDLDAVAIATPVSTHYPLAVRCLEAGKHVLLEKPLADTVEHAELLVRLAAVHDRILMVDHTYLFGNPFRKIKELIEHDELGELNYIDGVRINLGLFQRDINVIWDLAPHDLAMVDKILSNEAISLSAWGGAHADERIEDVAYLNLDFGSHLMANFHVNWLSPLKVRQMIFAGKRRSLVFNELNVGEPIKIYDRGIDVSSNSDSQRRVQIGYRSGDILSPNIEPREALQVMITHFADCILNNRPCQSDGQMGLRIVRYLEAATRSIEYQGVRIHFSDCRDERRRQTHEQHDSKQLFANLG